MGPRRHSSIGRLRSRGFTLLELTLVLSIGAGFMLVMVLSMHTHVLQIQAQAMAERYRWLHAASLRYTQVYRSHLVAAPLACSAPLYRADTPLTLPAAIASGDCAGSWQVNGQRVVVANILQPTENDLRALGLLAPGLSVDLLLENSQHVYQPDTGQGRVVAPSQLAVLVSSLCRVSPCPEPMALEHLIYNLQPYLLEGGAWAFNRRDQVNVLFNELGNGVMMSSGTTSSRDLIGLKGEFTRDNPIRDPSGAGVGSIVALRGVSLPGGEFEWARRDGKSPISGPWDFKANDLHGVASLKAETFEGQNLRLSGRAELDAAVAHQMDVNLLHAHNLRLPQVSPGERCSPDRGDLAVNASSGKLLVCDRTSLSWTAAGS